MLVGLAAGVATLLLRPRSGLIEPAAVQKTGYFSAREIERAEEFRGPQRTISLVALAVSGGTLALIALRPSRRMRRALERAGARPIAGGAAVGAGLSLVLALASLPLDAVAHKRAYDVGLSTQEWLPWLGDVGKSSAIATLFAAGLAAGAVSVSRAAPRRWWAPAAVGVTAVSAAFVFLSPLVLEPVFNKFTPLPEGPLRADVLRLAERSGVDVGEVFRMDASRRGTAVNAYIGGLGATKRVVLYDNLVDGFPDAEVRSVVAHELAHQRYSDLPKGLLWLAIVTLPATLLAQRLTERLAPGTVGSPAMLPALALSVTLISLAVGSAGNVLSRQVEARADAFALELTRDPSAFIALERRLATRNISDPDPPALMHALFGTHPTTLERIGYGVSWQRREG